MADFNSTFIIVITTNSKFLIPLTSALHEEHRVACAALFIYGEESENIVEWNTLEQLATDNN